MKASCDIKIEFDNEETVKTILRSVKVDDFNFIKSKISGKSLEAHITSNSVSSLLHTLDDYLACINVANKVMNNKD
jgi:tRNA threonylcarbamoyladenosine modification (KEOPS) complex  Pcc1 subunit